MPRNPVPWHPPFSGLIITISILSNSGFPEVKISFILCSPSFPKLPIGIHTLPDRYIILRNLHFYRFILRYQQFLHVDMQCPGHNVQMIHCGQHLAIHPAVYGLRTRQMQQMLNVLYRIPSLPYKLFYLFTCLMQINT